jgi:hypothetical protein
MASLGSSAMQASGPSMSLDKGAGGGGVGNYKGVMLCNRPFAGSVANKNAGASGKKNTFICGLVAEAAGIGQSMASKDQKKVKRPKKETVLTKHRRWLAELQKTKDKLEMQFVEEMKAKEASRDAFQKQEKAMRAMSKEILTADAASASDSKNNAAGPETNSPPSAAQSKQISSKILKRPAWALTEDVAAVKSTNDDDEFNDDEGLLNFAENLNFEQVIGDIEVKNMMQKLKERIAYLETDIKNEGAREKESEERLAMRIKMGENVANNEDEGEEYNEEEDVRELARLVLSDDSSHLGNVHSQASVEAMLKQAKDKIAEVSTIADAKINGTTQQQMGRVEGGPKLVMHEPSDGTRVENKTAVNNLPYMHRNPAV